MHRLFYKEEEKESGTTEGISIISLNASAAAPQIDVPVLNYVHTGGVSTMTYACYLFC